MRESDFLMSNITLPNFIDSWLMKRRQIKEHPDWLLLNGLLCFCGEQGSGKTLSAVQYVRNVAKYWPEAVIVSNIDLRLDVENRILPYEGLDQMVDYENGENGVIYLIDEMQLEFNSLESKGMDVRTFELVSQQRKARKHIVGTTQVFGRLAKPFREQFKYAILCRNLIGSLFRQEVFRAKNVAYEDDIKTELSSECVRWYFANPEMFACYDTSQIVRRVRNGGFDSDGTVRKGR